jgi:hypothetical protein
MNTGVDVRHRQKITTSASGLLGEEERIIWFPAASKTPSGFACLFVCFYFSWFYDDFSE